jgi:hypothetical protein
MWERQYEKAVFWFEKLNGDTSKDGREGLAFKGASLVRLGKNLEAAKVYEQYVQDFPKRRADRVGPPESDRRVSRSREI